MRSIKEIAINPFDHVEPKTKDQTKDGSTRKAPWIVADWGCAVRVFKGLSSKDHWVGLGWREIYQDAGRFFAQQTEFKVPEINKLNHVKKKALSLKVIYLLRFLRRPILGLVPMRLCKLLSWPTQRPIEASFQSSSLPCSLLDWFYS